MTLLALAFSALGAAHPDAAPPAAEADVQAWIRVARSGDSGGARALYRAYVGRVYRTVRPLCADDAEAEDVTQEAFARALEALDRYEAREGTRFIAWLSTVALNVARRSRRRRVRARPMDPVVLAQLADEEAPQLSEVASEAIDAVVLRAALLRALETLGEREREVVTLRYGGELDASEIAALTGQTHANVRKIEQRARGALRAELDRALAPRAMPRRTQR